MIIVYFLGRLWEVAIAAASCGNPGGGMLLAVDFLVSPSG